LALEAAREKKNSGRSQFNKTTLGLKRNRIIWNRKNETRLLVNVPRQVLFTGKISQLGLIKSIGPELIGINATLNSGNLVSSLARVFIALSAPPPVSEFVIIAILNNSAT
jgi:hypothetical protein